MTLGILMTRHRLTEDEAFQWLRDGSNRRNIELPALAEEVTYTGDLPCIAVGA